MNCKNYEILSNVQLKRIGEHKYSHSGQTLLDPLMQKYWTWFVSYFPVWLAPNVMTLTGLCVNIITSLILVYYSPDAKQHVSIIDQQKQLIVINYHIDSFMGFFTLCYWFVHISNVRCSRW